MSPGRQRGTSRLETQTDANIEIAYFGLLPSFIGHGLGGALLTAAVERAWALGARRVWVHTCSLDHPPRPARLSGARLSGVPHRAHGTGSPRETSGAVAWCAAIGLWAARQHTCLQPSEPPGAGYREAPSVFPRLRRTKRCRLSPARAAGPWLRSTAPATPSTTPSASPKAPTSSASSPPRPDRASRTIYLPNVLTSAGLRLTLSLLPNRIAASRSSFPFGELSRNPPA